MTDRIKVDVPDGAKLLTTAQAAVALNRRPQTLRIWAMHDRDAPIKPVRINGRLGWRPADIDALLNGDVAQAAANA